ncbi:MAG: TIR domain-containing protein [Anaerolineae bacterium]
MQSSYDAFISYSHHDREWVRGWLLPRLEQAGCKVCIDYRDFDIGVPTLVNIEHSVERSARTLLVLSPSWVKSQWTDFESLLAQTQDMNETQRRMLPLLLTPCQLPGRIRIITYADFTDTEQPEDEVQRVIAAIRGTTADSQSSTADNRPMTTNGQAPLAPRLSPPAPGNNIDTHNQEGGINLTDAPRVQGSNLTGHDQYVFYGPVTIQSAPPPIQPPDHPTTPPPDHPTLPPNLVHPYPLQANFTGRVQERQALSAWLKDARYPICALVAMGGMGKSALSWYWLQNDVLKDSVGEPSGPSPSTRLQRVSHASPPFIRGALDGVMWWSFYERDASFTKFIDEALRYVSGQEIDAKRLPTSYDRALALVHLLQTRRILFVLDGFERQIRAYARLDAPYQPDDETDPSNDARACVDPLAARWLQTITTGVTRAQVLITTRLMVRDLEDRGGYPLWGVHRWDLTALASEDATAFLRAQGVKKGTDAELAHAAAQYGNHPLSLRLLSGLIARDRKQPGDIAAAPRHDVYSDLVQRQHHVLQQSYDALPEQERTLLSRLAAFRSPMDYEAVAVFNELGQEARFDGALDDLQARGLLQRDLGTNRYDLHPIVRHYAYDRLTDKPGVHTRLRDYFAKVPKPEIASVQSIDEVLPTIELYHHTVRSGRVAEAWSLYNDRLRSPLYYHLLAYQEDIKLLNDLSEPTSLTQLVDPQARTWVFLYLGMDYERTGQMRLAVDCSDKALAASRKSANPGDVGAVLVEHASISRKLGSLKRAWESSQEAIRIFDVLDEANWRGISHRNYGHILAICGIWNMALEQLEIAEQAYMRHGEDAFLHGLSRVWIYRSLIWKSQGMLDQAAEAARKAQELATRGHYLRERAMGLFNEAVIASRRTEMASAELKLRKVLELSRQRYLVDLESPTWLELARLKLMEATTEKASDRAPLMQEAQDSANQALEIAERCEYRLDQADAHNLLAEWWQTQAASHPPASRERRQALAAARDHATRAKERAWCDGPPHYYKVAYEKAEKLIKQLGA